MMRVMLILMGALSLIALSCAEERPPIDRVQPFALKKSFFIGERFQSIADDPEFWTQGTLIDVGYGASQDGLFTSTYAQPMSRIKWQMTEDLLIGRISYERIDGSDGKGLNDDGTKSAQDGVIAVTFRILSHFDIINGYNPTTGEELNIRQENSVDRPWYEREYIRVDWSQNLNMDSYDFDTLSMLGVYGGLRYEPMRYDITDPRDPHAPVFDFEDGYFDITNKAFVKPGEIDLSQFGWGIKSFPSCFLDADFMNGTAPAGTCNPVELTIRHSFRRVVDTDFEPQDWDGFRFRAFGAFTQERTGYARNYGIVDAKWRRFITRYNIWQRSHYYDDPETMDGPIACNTPETIKGDDPNLDEDGDGTVDACEEAGEGSRCDVTRRRCTLPYRERRVRPIVWHYTQESDLEYFDATKRATLEWDVGLRLAVRSAQYSECARASHSKCVQEIEDEDDFSTIKQKREEARACVDEASTSCVAQYPIHFGQQDQNESLIGLTTESQICLERGRRASGGFLTDEVKTSCEAELRDLAMARGLKEVDALVSLALMDPMVLLCHSPVEANDPNLCASATQRLPEELSAEDCATANADSDTAQECAAAFSVRMGDLRYHQVNVLKHPQTPSPWGIYTDAEDPLTGETISASINVWGHVNDLWSQKVIDALRYMKGELTTEEVTDGEYVSQWARAAERAAAGELTPKMTKAQRDARLVDLATDGVWESEAERQQAIERLNTPLPPEIQAQALAVRHQVQQISAHLSAPSQNQITYMNRAQHAHGTEVEATLFDPMVQQLMGVDGLPPSEEVLNRASLLRGGNPSIQRNFQLLKENALAERGACIMHEAPAPHGFGSLADALQRKFGEFNPEDPEDKQAERAEKMRRYLAHRAHYAVIVHEMGHSVGLRHNFVSSSDAYNYRPQYWQLRTKNGTVNGLCQDLSETGEECVGPRYFDPVTENERDHNIWMWMHSSVMDYAGEPTQDMLGLGAYDFAAARAFYGDVYSVYKDASYALEPGNTRAQGVMGKLDNFGGILGFTWDISTGDQMNPTIPLHYSQLNGQYDLIQDCETVDVDAFTPSDWDKEIDGKWDPTFDGLIVKVDGEYSRCAQQKVDYRKWDDLITPDDREINGFTRSVNSVSAIDRRTRVPYGFGTDSWADVGNLSVYRHDNGADAYELFDFFIAQQEVNHIFDNYRRGRMGFSVRKASGRTLGRYNAKMRDGAKGLGLYKTIFGQRLLNLGYNFDEFWSQLAADFLGINLLASGVAFDHFTRQLARPESGPHAVVDDVLRSQNDASGLESIDTALNIPNGATGFFETVGIGGRPIENRLSNDQGEYSNRYTINAGSYYEKMYTAMLMTESVDNFISSDRSEFVDGRFRSVSMADVFPEGYRRWLANNLTNDASIKGPRLRVNRRGEVDTDEGLFPTQPIGWISWWGSAPRACFPGQNAIFCDSFGDENPSSFGASTSEETIAIDPQVGWEQQKFLIAWTMMYLPENQQQWWIDQLRLWELGVDADPGFEHRIEFHAPQGKTYIARTFGTEVIFGQRVQRGVAARVLEYANDLLARAYEVTPGPDLNGDDTPDWWLPVYDEERQKPIVKYDPSISSIFFAGTPGCNDGDSSQCVCEANRACVELRQYLEIPYFLRQALDAYGLGSPSARGVY